MYSAENGGFQLKAHSGGWWGKSTVYLGIQEVVFVLVFKNVSRERIPVTIQDS